MCERASFIAIRGGKIAWLIGSDSHDEIIKAEGLEDKDLCDRRFVRVECTPKADPFSTNQNEWEVKEDELENTLPAWYEHEEWVPKILDELTLRRIPEERRTGTIGKLVIPASTEYSLPWLRKAADIYVLENATLTAPVLAQARNIDVHKKGELNAPLLTR